MKINLLILFFISLSTVFSQKELKDFSLLHSLKQDKEQYQFMVLDNDKKGPRIYRKNRFYFWFKAQKVMTTQGGSSGQLLHGDFEAFHDNKQLSKKGAFKKGLKQGEWLYWRPDGTLIKTENWQNGILRGVETLYDTSGRPSQTIIHKRKSIQRENNDSLIIEQKNGRRQTIYLKDSTENVFAIEKKKNGKYHGTQKQLENNKVISKTKYKNGELIAPKEKDETEKKWWQIFKKKGESSSAEDSKKEKKVKEEKDSSKKKDNTKKTMDKSKEKEDKNPEKLKKSGKE